MTPSLARPATVVAILAVALAACADSRPTLTGPETAANHSAALAFEMRLAINAQSRHTDALLEIPGVVGTAVGRLPNGRTGIRVFLASPNVEGVPGTIAGVPVATEVTGLFVALSDPTTRLRPAPLGFSVGHPAITAGTLGARVINSVGTVFILSNNHVLANGNNASIGDATWQPGAYDGGTAADQIGTLAAFRAIDFSSTAANTMDAALAQVNGADVGFGTPGDDGYGVPGSTIFGDANGDGLIDDKNALLGIPVQKYGRTTKLTKGTITGINATVSICYEVVFIFCTKSARFVDQLIIEPGGFSGGGDSGSLIVTDDASRSPVALLFAGSSTQTIANRLDLVLAHFGVSIDAGNAPPPTPLVDIAVASVTAPTSVTQGATASVVVTVRNVGTADVASPFDVTLDDVTDGLRMGTQAVPGLAPGASASLTFSWNTSGASIGAHTLSAAHAFADENATNNERSTTTTVNPPSVGIHIGDLDGFPMRGASSWSATVDITVHDANHQPLNGVTVVGRWSRSGLNSNTCTTGDGGGNGTCIVLFPSISLGASQIRFTVSSATRTGFTYESAANHDPDGDSNGTAIIVRRP
ncbi:MAG TPA: CARDB domain-containing protein [Gemmatimonadaceae bacterium]|nr:CARDB domain-containing protein [Gemmatimonadaceae bacterium]